MIGLARIYRVNSHYVVAKSVEDAVRIFYEAEESTSKDILEVKLLADGKYPDFAYIDKQDEPCWKPTQEQIDAVKRVKAAIGPGPLYDQLGLLLDDLNKLM